MKTIPTLVLAAAILLALAPPARGEDAAPAATQFTVKNTFTTTSAWGMRPHSLVRGTDGLFYGTTTAAGAGGQGTAYRMTAKGVITTLYPFGLVETDPTFVLDALIQASDGFFYGVGRDGGVANRGAVFRLSKKGQLKLMHSFAAGEAPQGPVMQASDGNLYGVSTSGGANANGFVYRISLKGKYAVLLSFGASSTAGHGFQDGLTQAADGHLYSTGLVSGPSNFGTLYRVTLQGAFTLLHAFTGGAADGGQPKGGLTVGPDGLLYGTTSVGGLSSGGVLFKIDTAGAFTKLSDFAANSSGQPSNPFGRLTLGTDGAFYGAANYGGTPLHVASGSIYRATTAGVVTPLHAFTNGTDGEHPGDAPVEGANQVFMGVSSDGGGVNTLGVAYTVK